MNKIVDSVLEKSANQMIGTRYLHYRQCGTTRITAWLFTLLLTFAWIILQLESSSWQWVRRNHSRLFPQINANCPRFGDPLRYLLQGICLILLYCRPPQSEVLTHNPDHEEQKQIHQHTVIKVIPYLIKSWFAWINTLPQRFKQSAEAQKTVQFFNQMNKGIYTLFMLLASVVSCILIIACITQPFQAHAQFIFLLLLWVTAMSIRHLPGRGIPILLIMLSLLASSRYLWWRYHATLLWEDPLSLFFGLLLIFAETYIWLVLILGYFQTIWPLHRLPVSLPEDTSAWPTIDVYITTYNEDLSILKPGVYASLGLDWPEDKINIYILDDGNRPSFKEFAEEVGVQYIARPTHEHAKAGNINYALKQTNGDLIAMLDCDHIPTHSFLQLTAGWFLKDPKLALVQTPHHFFSPDPFERNLGSFQKTPSENALFYGVIQDGNDTWGATFFCGSAGILRRTALDKIGGFAVDSVTEDAQTSLRLQLHGYTSAYIRIPLVAGLATENLASYIGQRTRWARGMIQILRTENPLTAKGLTWSQRICYFNSMLHFLLGIPRLIFLTIPLAFLVFHAYIIAAPALMILLYGLPHLTHATLANSRIQGKYRHFLWNEIYETVVAWYIAIPTTIALFNPAKGKFNVTSKGGLTKTNYVDWKIARPFLILLIINLLGLAAGVWRLSYGPGYEMGAVIISIIWVLYNIIILGGALGVDIESKQVRSSPRIDFTMPASITRNDGHAFPCILNNYSDNGIGIELKKADLLKEGETVFLILKRNQEEFSFPCEVARLFDLKAGLRLGDLSLQQHIDFFQCTFARSDTWTLWQNQLAEDKPLQNMLEVMKLNFRGYMSIIEYTPPKIRSILRSIVAMISWIISFAPRVIKNSKS